MPTNSDSERQKRAKRKITSPADVSNPVAKHFKKQKLTKKEMDEIKSLIDGLSKQVTESQSVLGNQIKDLKSELKSDVTDINGKLNDIQNKVDSKLTTFEVELSNQTFRMDNVEDDIKRVTLLNQLRILGFPTYDNNMLNTVFSKIASKIGYSTEKPIDIPSIKQIPMKKRDGTTANGGPILLSFNAMHIKAKFYSLYLRNMPLKSEDFGLDSNTKIIIGENLTKLNAEIFSLAKQMKKSNAIAQTYTDNGLVYIKLQKGREHLPVLIRSCRQLEQLAANGSNIEMSHGK